MRVLVIDDRAIAAVKRVMDHATKPGNVYVVGPGGSSVQHPPGEDWRHMARLSTYRCVFSLTRADGKMWRHLSISVPGEKYPHVFAAFTIAELFGFTGWSGTSYDELPADWIGRVDERDHCVVLAQEYHAEQKGGVA